MRGYHVVSSCADGSQEICPCEIRSSDVKRWAGVDVPRDHVAGWKGSRRFWRRPAIAGLRFRERAAVPEPFLEHPRYLESARCEIQLPIVINFGHAREYKLISHTRSGPVSVPDIPSTRC